MSPLAPVGARRVALDNPRLPRMCPSRRSLLVLGAAPPAPIQTAEGLQSLVVDRPLRRSRPRPQKPSTNEKKPDNPRHRRLISEDNLEVGNSGSTDRSSKHPTPRNRASGAPVDSLSQCDSASAPARRPGSGSQRHPVPRSRATRGLPGGYRKGIASMFPRSLPAYPGESI
jgi:hypothetical protein